MNFFGAPRLFAIHDSDKRGGAIEINQDAAAQYNERGFGIFWSVNEFVGARRAENLARIRFWFADLDGDKPLGAHRINNAPMMPSAVVETKHGWHVYYAAHNATIETWREIERGLVRYFDADSHATDVLRLLRVPGYWHQKQPESPFRVQLIYADDLAVYSESQMLRMFPAAREVPLVYEQTPDWNSGSLWGRAARIPAQVVLDRLNGHKLIRGEMFRLGRESSQHTRPLIDARNGRSTPCFVGSRGTLHGVRDGPGVACFLRWYGHSWSDIAYYIKTIFPETDDQPTNRLCR